MSDVLGKVFFDERHESLVLKTAHFRPHVARNWVRKERPDVGGQTFWRNYEPIPNGLKCAVQMENERVHKQGFVFGDRCGSNVYVRREDPAQFWMREKSVPQVSVVSG